AFGGNSLVVKIPAFRGKTRAQATLLASQLGLRPVFRTQASSRRPGIVVRQRPRAGTEVAAGADIVLFVSKGSAPSGSASSSPAPSPPAENRRHHGKPKPPGHHHHHKKPKPHGH